MTLFITVLHVLVCFVLIIVVLLQRGKGAEVGAVFGGGGGNTMFGARGAGNFLTRLTTASAVIFMFTSLTLAYFGRTDSGLLEGIEEPPEAAAGFEEVPGGETAPAETDSAPEAGGFEAVEPAADAGGFEAVEPQADADAGGFEAVEPDSAQEGQTP